jgi:tetratricopeptide (TPR) repeat protein
VDTNLQFPAYIPRAEENRIRDEARLVDETRQSRAMLLYGAGGSGKSRMLRQLHRTSQDGQRAIWLEPIDVDDSEYWLLSNLERRIAKTLDPKSRYFKAYHDDLQRLAIAPSADASKAVSREIVRSHLIRINQVFQSCYRDYVEGTGHSVVMLLDTVEAIRGTSLLLTLALWMKALPATLFVLAGRPSAGQQEDPILSELRNPNLGIETTTVPLGDFSRQEARDYLGASNIGAGLDADEKEKLVLFSRGHPLWLAFTISYLATRGLPEEAEVSLDAVARAIPFGSEPSPAGRAMIEEFTRRLLTPYREVDFWHEAIKVLAVVRQAVNRQIWQRLMADQPLPADVASLDEAWEQLLAIPWVRQRANGQFVTLHDAVAEELAERYFRLNDIDGRSRQRLWKRAAVIYRELTDQTRAPIEAAEAAQELKVRSIPVATTGKGREPTTEERAIAVEKEQLDARRREVDQFRVAAMFYQLLSDHDTGCQVFLDLFAEARATYDVLFQELICLEMQRFLPGTGGGYALGDVVGGAIDEFRSWLSAAGTGPRRHLQVGLDLADHLVAGDRAQEALDVLDALPAGEASYQQLYDMSVLRGNACMRITGRVREGRGHFNDALAHARHLTAPDRDLRIANAHKEMGFYYRNQGLWRAADEAYAQARDALRRARAGAGVRSDVYLAEAASIDTNWAYVKGLVGMYRDGEALAESAIVLRRNLGQRQREGISLSVCGEVYRYERRFEKAWEAYKEAEQVFRELSSWQWLGVIHQEQAICLYHAVQDHVTLVPQPLTKAEELITLALEICQDHSVRNYPSALNRAGRIFGHRDIDKGLRHLAEGIDAARDMSDGWFWCASLLEYLELSYRGWTESGESRYLDQIEARRPEIDRAMSEYEFDHLRGRWYLLEGHLAVHSWQASEDAEYLDNARSRYAEGFRLMAEGYVASSGANAIPNEFVKFGQIVESLPATVRSDWTNWLASMWSRTGKESTLLLTRLEELY